MKKIILVAETGSDITPELAAQYQIQMVPMHVAFGLTTMDDGSFPVEDICTFYHTTGIQMLLPGIGRQFVHSSLHGSLIAPANR